MDFNAIVEMFRRNVTEHYFDMSGRVGKKEYWWFVAACIAVSFAAWIIDAIVGLGVLRPIVSLALLLPMAGMTARRMQDTGRNSTLVWAWVVLYAVMLVIALMTALAGPLGALAFLGLFLMLGGLMMLVALATLVVAVVLIYYCIQPGNAEANAYGPPPPVFDPTTPAAPKAS
jgi:uncharacterized membrane protein YhaH (DUF805 family)